MIAASIGQHRKQQQDDAFMLVRRMQLPLLNEADAYLSRAEKCAITRPEQARLDRGKHGDLSRDARRCVRTTDPVFGQLGMRSLDWEELERRGLITLEVETEQDHDRYGDRAPIDVQVVYAVLTDRGRRWPAG
jgi:hypothetical protein